MSAIGTIKISLSSVDDVVLISDDLVAQKVLIGWSRYRPDFKDSPLKKGENSYAALGRLWEEVGPIDFPRLALLSGVPETRAAKSFERLRAANLVWPDGTISTFATTLVRGRSNSILRSYLPRVSPPPLAKPEKK